MSLTSALNIALAGLNVTQSGLSVISGNLPQIVERIRQGGHC